MHGQACDEPEAEDERLALAFLCQGEADHPVRLYGLGALRSHSWRHADDAIVFRILERLAGRPPEPLRTLLPAELARLGFPEVDCDRYFRPHRVSEREALQLFQKLSGKPAAAQKGCAEETSAVARQNPPGVSKPVRLDPAHARGHMTPPILRALRLLDVIGVPIFTVWYIWQLQFRAWWTWVVFPVWVGLSFLVQRDTPQTLGWRADNLWPAAKEAFLAFALMGAGLLAIGLSLGASWKIPPNLASVERLWTYFAFCVLQQVAFNSLLNNRMISLLRRRWISSLLMGAIFGACHWPNPVLVPLTFVGGTVMAWLFARHRNILPLAVGQALLGSLAWWSFPVAWHHHLRVGPGYYVR